MQRGHWKRDCRSWSLYEASFGEECGLPFNGPRLFCRWLSSRGCVGAGLEAGEFRLPAAAAMAALRTCGNVGLMPQDWHGGSGVLAFAVAGSKLGGTGLENEQITQTQVALLGWGVFAPPI